MNGMKPKDAIWQVEVQVARTSAKNNLAPVESVLHDISQEITETLETQDAYIQSSLGVMISLAILSLDWMLDWLDEDHEDYQTEAIGIFPAVMLPTFNAYTIGTHIYGLAKNKQLDIDQRYMVLIERFVESALAPMLESSTRMMRVASLQDDDKSPALIFLDRSVVFSDVPFSQADLPRTNEDSGDE